MIRPAFIFLLMLTPLAAVYTQTTQPGLLDWLQGIWLDDNKGIYEDWKKTGENTMVAEGYRLEKGIRDIHEKITLFYTLEGANYSLNILEDGKSAGSYVYKSIEFNREKAFFANQNNNFPAKIKYERQGTDSLQVLLYDSNNNLKVTHNFKRIQR